MSDLMNERDELLEAVKEPVMQATPSNFALYIAIVFANIVFLFLDVISGITVYWLTTRWYYGVLTGFAGFIPLAMHELLYTRAYASKNQKIISLIGAGVGLASIIVIGLAAGAITVWGGNLVGAKAAEYGVIAVLILITVFHGLLAGGYFYTDMGIRAYQQKSQAVARAHQQGEMIDAGGYILMKTQEAVNKRKVTGSKYNSPAALAEVLRQMGLDQNNNGIPDFLEGRRVYNQNAPTPRTPAQPPSPPKNTGGQAPNNQNVTNYTLDTFLAAVGMDKAEFKAFLMETDTFSKAWQVLRDDGRLPAGITHKNFNELCGQVNPTPASGNGKHPTR